MTPAESVIAKMRSWLTERGNDPPGTTRVLAFPDHDIKALLEHVDEINRDRAANAALIHGGGKEQSTPLGGKLTQIDLAKENEKLR